MKLSGNVKERGKGRSLWKRMEKFCNKRRWMKYVRTMDRRRVAALSHTHTHTAMYQVQHSAAQCIAQPTCVQALESAKINTYSCSYLHEMSSRGGLQTGLQHCKQTSLSVLCQAKSRLGRPSVGEALQAVTKREGFYYNVKVSGIFIYRNTLAPFQNGANRISQHNGVLPLWRSVQLALPSLCHITTAVDTATLNANIAKCVI